MDVVSGFRVMLVNPAAEEIVQGGYGMPLLGLGYRLISHKWGDYDKYL